MNSSGNAIVNKHVRPIVVNISEESLNERPGPRRGLVLHDDSCTLQSEAVTSLE